MWRLDDSHRRTDPAVPQEHRRRRQGAPFAIDSLIGQSKVALTPGTVTLVVFWATWCEPCKKLFPKYQELYVNHKASGLEIAAVSVDEERSGIADFAKRLGATFPVGWDEGWKVADQYQRPGVPTAYIIGKSGKVKHIHRGYRDGEENEIEKEIESLL